MTTPRVPTTAQGDARLASQIGVDPSVVAPVIAQIRHDPVTALIRGMDRVERETELPEPFCEATGPMPSKGTIPQSAAGPRPVLRPCWKCKEPTLGAIAQPSGAYIGDLCQPCADRFFAEQAVNEAVARAADGNTCLCGMCFPSPPGSLCNPRYKRPPDTLPHLSAMADRVSELERRVLQIDLINVELDLLRQRVKQLEEKHNG